MPVVPSVYTVVTVNGVADEPDPVTSLWLTGVCGVDAPRLDVAVLPC